MKTTKKFLLLLLIAFAVFCGVQIKGGYDKYQAALADRPLAAAIEELQSIKNYTVYEDIPQIYFQALVSVEDRRFYQHNGFDIIGTARAVYNDIKAWELREGGSTIAQQLAKNMYFSQEGTLQRKIAEVLMAVKIEREYTKEEVLEFYINSIYYGSGYYCIYDAAMGYFNKRPSEMTDDECTLLVGIPNAPSVYSLDVNPALAYRRQEKVVESMVECGYIAEEEKERYLSD